MSTADVTGLVALVVSLVGVTATGVGLYLARNQLHRAVTAAEAASTATARTERLSLTIALMEEIPNLGAFSDDLSDLYLSEDNRADADRILTRWVQKADQIRGMLDEYPALG